MAKQPTSTAPKGGKYTSLIIAISLFLLFELVILGLNFYASHGLDNDAVSINLSGRQRMLSQRTAKVIFKMQVDASQGAFPKPNKEELTKVVSLFDTTLYGFEKGATVIGGNEQPVPLQAVKNANEQALVKQAIAIWEPYKALLNPLLNTEVPSAEDLDKATDYAKENNLKLLKLMNDLTTSLEANTKHKAAQLKTIQTVALVVSLLLFLNIVFNALRKLRAADAEATKAQNETAEILNTVKEGLFLLDKDLNIGSQHSKSLSDILQRPIEANTPFLSVLSTLVSGNVFTASEDYIRLLLEGKVKESLVQSLNPLSQVRVSNNADAKLGEHYLSFQFNRVMVDKKIAHLLVTVQDVTRQVLQAQELEDIKSQAAIPLETLQNLLTKNQFQLSEFLGNALLVLNGANHALSEFSKGHPQQHAQRLDVCFRSIHSLKSEAGIWQLGALQRHAHEFEQVLANLRKTPEWEKSDLLALPVHLNAMYDEVTALQAIIESFKALQSAQAKPRSIAESMQQNLEQLTTQVAQNQGKQANIKCNITALNTLPVEAALNLQQICIQLVRNAICHGIEPADKRVALSKTSAGLIQVNAAMNGDAMELTVSDDGGGIVLSKLRAAMLRSGQFNADQISAMSNDAIMNQLFTPGFSTADNISTDAGHGIGMDVVKTNIENMGGTISINTKEDAYTEFVLHFPLKA